MIGKDDKGKVLAFPETEPPSVIVVPVMAELMTTDVMSQAVDRCVSRVRGEISANQVCNDGNGDNVVIQVNFGSSKER